MVRALCRVKIFGHNSTKSSQMVDNGFLFMRGQNTCHGGSGDGQEGGGKEAVNDGGAIQERKPSLFLSGSQSLEL